MYILFYFHKLGMHGVLMVGLHIYYDHCPYETRDLCFHLCFCSMWCICLQIGMEVAMKIFMFVTHVGM